ncbi:glycosyltransferase [Halanaerobium praevalens]|uniref:Glycosyl transferase group 1 n=1 Tax=Halanaerobium praevalens (strain ATCC 33744 / DSM 2228 / GSL) TaxID=572479 RepID=E3DN16_HALPG|nr:glycosyltransferase [Halanaerobium praevalens]ADO76422.1 glycosyl transferase group 1 [Halanaerobium praevalens DSM 2228]
MYDRKWPSKCPGINFCTSTCDGISKYSTTDNIFLFAVNNTNERDITEILSNEFNINPRRNFKIKLFKKYISRTKFILYLNFMKGFIKLNRSKKIDVIITRNTKLLPFLFLLKKLYNIKIVFETHHIYAAPHLREKKNRKKEVKIQKKILPKIDGIICLHNPQKEILKQNISQKNYLIARPGIYSKKKNNNWNKKYIGYVGSLSKNKGVEEIFYAYSKIKNNSIKLLIVGGKKNNLKKCHRLVEKLGISDSVKFTGWVNQKKLDYYLSQIKIGIVPAIDNFYNNYVSSPVKIFDYFSYSIPVIGSDIKSIRDIVTNDCGLFYKKGKTGELTNQMDRLNKDRNLYNELKNNIQKRQNDLLWEKRGKKIINFLEKI